MPGPGYRIAKRAVDAALASAGLASMALPLAAIGAAIRLTSKGPALHWSRRIGKGNHEFLMPKFRTMRIDAPQLPTHLMKEAANYLTPVGRLLRKTSLDELPQLYSILKGDMSFVGPRPALFNQDDLVALRTERGVHRLTPGLTGWAQVNGRDELPIPIKVEYDKYYLQNQSLWLDLKIMLLTAKKAITGEGVHH
jgi:O-antigen biosynthesis protein WbqP